MLSSEIIRREVGDQYSDQKVCVRRVITLSEAKEEELLDIEQLYISLLVG